MAKTKVATAANAGQMLKWNEYAIAFDGLPGSTLFALAARGFTHILGNEVAAYESGLKAKRDEHGNAAYSATEIAVMVHDRREEKLAEMAAGTLGYRASGPRLPQEERLARDIAKEYIVAAFHAKGRAKDMPKASDAKAWDGYVDRYLDIPANAAKVSAEVTRRMAKPDVTDDDLAFLKAAVAA